MLFTFDKNSKKISMLTETTLKSQKILERQHMEKWIENYPAILGEELLIITTEYDKFDKTNERLDLLALDKEGNLVVIELKRDDSGRHVDLQALKYAAYCSTLSLKEIIKMHQMYLKKKKQDLSDDMVTNIITAFITNDDFEELSDKPRIIIVSKEFRPEVTASVLWLRKYDLDITCVKLTPYLLYEDTIAFESVRRKQLTKIEQRLLKGMLSTEDNMKKCAISILMEDNESFNKYFQNLTLHEKEEFSTYPIYSLVKNTNLQNDK